MNKLMRIFALSLLVLPLSVLAEVKVGFVNTAKLMEEAPQAQDASKQMETEFAPREGVDLPAARDQADGGQADP